MTSLVVERTPDPPPDWRGFSHAHGSFYHDPRWAIALRDAFGYRLVCLSARQTGGGAVQGILALAEVPPLFGPRRLVSLPFSYAAGPLALSPDARVALLAAARDAAAGRGARRLEIKQLKPEAAPAPGFTRTARYATYRVDTGGDVWSRLDASSTRRSIRKAQQLHVHADRGESAADWGAMSALQDSTARSHGVPAPPRRFFVQTCRGLQRDGLAELYLTRVPDGRLAAAGVLWRGPREWIYAFGASDQRLLDYRPNHLLLWTMLEQAAAAGVTFDLGRAAPEQQSLVEFKRRWGGQPVPLAYDYWPQAAGLNVRARDRGMLAFGGRLWSRLPTPIARLGAVLYRFLG